MIRREQTWAVSGTFDDPLANAILSRFAAPFPEEPESQHLLAVARKLAGNGVSEAVDIAATLAAGSRHADTRWIAGVRLWLDHFSACPEVAALWRRHRGPVTYLLDTAALAAPAWSRAAARPAMLALVELLFAEDAHRRVTNSMAYEVTEALIDQLAEELLLLAPALQDALLSRIPDVTQDLREQGFESAMSFARGLRSGQVRLSARVGATAVFPDRLPVPFGHLLDADDLFVARWALSFRRAARSSVALYDAAPLAVVSAVAALGSGRLKAEARSRFNIWVGALEGYRWARTEDTARNALLHRRFEGDGR